MANEGKYMIHATIRADGTVARKDVVGAIFGQTEGLLGGLTTAQVAANRTHRTRRCESEQQQGTSQG